MVCIEKEKDIRKGVLFCWYHHAVAYKQKEQQRICCSFVGVARLERATACTPCKNASQLHHTPIGFAAAKIRMFFELLFTLRKKSYLCTG